MVYLSKVTSRGQITLPQKIRDDEGITENDYVIIQPAGSCVLVRKAEVNMEEIMKIFQKEAKRKGVTKKEILDELEAVRKARYKKKE
ncbi:AbrB/MazE/SpoVT family DNA-binding domain-containing protein [Candidatus Micrarchaeota archaeon]|nr:AbrB/MazE/SpoVT family DNA-binding domain-containing protein [Candidatus Micrarchaeota archaeon]